MNRPSKPKRKRGNFRSVFYWTGGPAPTTERGKRRHANREHGRAEHAKYIWRGGYTPSVGAN